MLFVRLTVYLVDLSSQFDRQTGVAFTLICFAIRHTDLDVCGSDSRLRQQQHILYFHQGTKFCTTLAKEQNQIERCEK